MDPSWAEWIASSNNERERSLLQRVPLVLQSTESAIKAGVPRGDGSEREITLFSTNDYLGLSSHPDVKRAIAAAASTHGNGTRASAIVSGHSQVHEALEAELAALKHAEAALLFPSGFAANSGCLAALCGSGGRTAVFSDALNHASLIDGIRMATRDGSQVHVFPHLDYTHLEAQLRSCPEGVRKLVVTDGVFSMDGDIADLQTLARLKQRYGFLLVVDDAHGTLVLGERGGGAAEAAGVCAAVDVHTGTLSKAFGALGGFVACSAAVKRFIVNRARPYIYSTALPIPVVAGALAALHVFRRDRWMTCHLQRLMAKVAAALRCQVETPIVAVVVGPERATLQLASTLWEAGFHCPAIRPPTVPAGTSRLRITLSAQHSEADVDRLLAALRDAGLEVLQTDHAQCSVRGTLLPAHSGSVQQSKL